MQRLSSNMDKLLAYIQRDIRFRKANRKIQYPTPKINPRIPHLFQHKRSAK